MPSYVPPKNGVAYITYVTLVSQANTKIMQTTPTLAAGDVKVSIDGGALADLATLPTVTPAGGRRVKVSLSAGEMSGDNIGVLFSDAAGSEWCDLYLNIQTSARGIDDLATATNLATANTNIDTLIASITSVGAMADAVWDEAVSGHLSSGTVGAALNAAGSAGDPWTTALPGAYGAGSAGKIIGDNINQTISSLPSAATIAAAVWASGTRTLTSFGTLIADIWAAVTRTLTSGGGASAADVWTYGTRTITSGGGGATPAEIWTYGNRILTQTAAQVQEAVSGSNLAMVSAVSFEALLTGFAINPAWNKCYFTVKSVSHLSSADTDSVLQIVVTNGGDAEDGLLYLNGEAGTAGDASLVVDDDAGTVEIIITDDATADIPAAIYRYDIKLLMDDDSSVLLTTGQVTVTKTPTGTV